MRVNWFFFACQLALIGLLASSAPGRAQDGETDKVVLRLKGGGFELRGVLKAFDGSRYVLESPNHGRMVLNAARYECIGAACAAAPSAATLDYEKLYPERAETVIVRGADALASKLLPALIKHS